MKYLICLFVAILSACSARVTIKESSPVREKIIIREVAAESPKPKKAKNIVFLIGDGMGINQITAGMYHYQRPYNLERIRHIGLHKNHSANDLITDSAAGATAFSCGLKTYNGAIGVDVDTIPRMTILEEAESLGLATGLVATSTIVHATPASFIAHVASRRLYEDIALDFLETDIDFFVGGGLKFFNRREDDRDLLDELTQKGYRMSHHAMEDYEDIMVSTETPFGYLTSDENPLPRSQGRSYLEKATMDAIASLSKRSEEGFFLMVEGSQIDWGGHSNNLDYVVTEMDEFDRVIGKVLDFAEKDGETLVIITADHECGGLSMSYGSEYGNLEENFGWTGHTLTLIPVFAYGPGSEAYAGIYQNSDLYRMMRNSYGWSEEIMGDIQSKR